MSNLGPRPDSADNEAGVAPSTFETGDFAAEPVSPAAPSFDAATVTPPEPETMPGYPRPAPESFTVPREPDSREPRDKLWVHFAWEGLLLVLIALGIAAFFLFGPSGGLINPDRVSEILAGYSPFLLFAALARHAHMSPRHYQRNFSRCTGTSPIRWLVDQRVRASLALLETTESTVEQVSAAVGFDTSVTFRHHFGRIMRTSPTAYRRAFRAATTANVSLTAVFTMIKAR